jgi:hypothetical protein
MRAYRAKALWTRNGTTTHKPIDLRIAKTCGNVAGALARFLMLCLYDFPGGKPARAGIPERVYSVGPLEPKRKFRNKSLPSSWILRDNPATRKQGVHRCFACAPKLMASHGRISNAPHSLRLCLPVSHLAPGRRPALAGHLSGAYCTQGHSREQHLQR